jgi:hypothetical protein
MHGKHRDPCVTPIRRAIEVLDFTEYRRNHGMLRSSLQVFLFTWVVVLASAGPGEDAGEHLKLGNLSNELTSNGGCGLQLPSQYAGKEGTFVFISDLENHGLVNVNGTDISVTLMRPVGGKQKHKPTIGERSTLVYAGNGVEVKVDYVVARTSTQRVSPENSPITTRFSQSRAGKRARGLQRRPSVRAPAVDGDQASHRTFASSNFAPATCKYRSSRAGREALGPLSRSLTRLFLPLPHPEDSS